MGNGNGGILEQGPRPGLIWDKRTGQWLEAKSIRDQIFFDTEQIITPITAGVSYFFFRNLSFPGGVLKTSVFTNMTTVSEFPAGWRAEIRKIGFRVLMMEEGGAFPAAEDMMRVLSEGSMEFTKSSQRLEIGGRLDMFPSGNGLNVFGNGIILPDTWMVNNGVPSLAAVPDMNIPIIIEPSVTFGIEVEFPRATVLNAAVYLLCELHTVLTQPM